MKKKIGKGKPADKRRKIKDLPGAKGDLTGKEMKGVKGGGKGSAGVNNFRVSVISG